MVAGNGKPGTVDEDVLDSQLWVATGAHQSRPAGHVVPVSQSSVSQTRVELELSPSAYSQVKWALLQLLKRIVVVYYFPGGPEVPRGCGNVAHIR